MSALQKISKSLIKYTRNAEEIYRNLNGVFAIYKPAGNNLAQVRLALLTHICRDLNGLDVRPPENYVHIDGDTTKQMTVRVEPSYADHPLVVGPRYQPDDFKLSWAHRMSPDMSGIMLIGVNGGTRMVHKIKESNATRFFKVKGVLGQATDNYFITGRIRERTTWKHVKRTHIDRMCASMQSSHQKRMFEACGLDIQSQAAYELAVQGPIRPAENRLPALYAMKCVDFKPPEFTLEIVCINEDDLFLKSLVHNMGMHLRSTATCSQIQCFQYGVFGIEDGLLKREWDLENIAKNMHACRKILGKHKYLFKQEDPILREYLYGEKLPPNDDVNLTR
ncbi:mitochondrial mRNA pseudouridine synthase Trub2 [Diachasma alloeum]|uniref:mitochondrial mRNA pseudouridine synthase Trub2 n=1 Tax=Diachasma alloeum TaxID=454923 RepID=UPI00073848AE|nr:mitochondrial mRNA pseudouridine synthase Trub2 [Diachasma alloeum]